MKKLLLFVLLIAGISHGAIVTFCPSGCAQTTPAAAFSAGGNFDTIQYNSGQDTAWTITAALTPKLGQKMWSQPGRSNTIQSLPGGYKMWDPAGDSTGRFNITFRVLSGTPTGTTVVIESSSASAGRGGNIDSGVVFINDNGPNSAIYCFDFSKPTAYAYETNRMVDCRIEGFGAYTYVGLAPTDTSQQSRWQILRCDFDNSRAFIPHKSIFSYNKVVYTGENQTGGGDSSILTYNYFNYHGAGSGENVTMDDSRGTSYWTINHNVYDSAQHVKLMIDGARHTTISYERCDTTYPVGDYDLYTHSATAAYDSCYNLTIANCYFKNGYNVATGGIHHNWMNLRSLMMLGGADLMVDSALLDTLRNSMWFGGKGTVQAIYIPSTSDTVSGVTLTATIVEGSRYPFLRQVANNPAIFNGDTAGPLIHLTNKIARITKNDTVLSFACSLSYDFAWSDPVRGDSGTVRLQDSSAAGTWAYFDSSVNLRSRVRSATNGAVIGKRDTLVRAGCTAGSIHKFRMITTATASGITFSDTSFAWFDTTTGGGADCDSLTHIGYSRTATTLADSCRTECVSDTIIALFDTDTSSGPFDTTRFLTNAQYDTVVLIKTGQTASDTVYVKWIDSVKTTGWIQIVMLDSTSDTVEVPVCGIPGIDSTLSESTRKDSVRADSSFQVFGIEFKSTGATWHLGDSTLAETDSSDTIWTLTCPAGMPDGDYGLYMDDSCGNRSDTLTVTVWSPPETPSYTLTVTDNGAGGTTTPAGASSVDSGAGTAIQADTATGYRFVRWDTTGVVSIADIYDASTACTLHSGNATVTAIFYYNILGLRADTVIYTSDSTIRAVYHFNASPQLSDWDTVGGVSMSISDRAMSLTGGSANLRGVQWKRHVAATSIQCYLSVGSGYRTTYAGINENNDGSTHLVNPSCGHLWGVTAGEGYWVRDGSTPGAHGLDAATTTLKFNIFEKYADSTRVNMGRTAFWDVRSETDTFDTSKTIFIGAAYGNTVVIDSVVIDGWIYTEVTHYSITASVNPALSGTIDLSSDSVEAGQPCTATVTPAAGYIYLGVSGDANDTGRQVVFTMTEDKTIQFNLVNDSAMVLLVKTDNTGTSGDSSFTISVNAVSADWRWYSGDGYDTSTTATSHTHKFPVASIYRVGFIHNNANGFSNPLFNNGGDRLKVLDLQRFGKNRCDALNRSFYGCEYMTISARDTLVSATVGSAELAFYGIAADTLPRLILPNCVTFIQFIAYDTNLVYIDTVYAPTGRWWQNAFDGCKKQKYFRGVHTDAGENFSAFLRNNTALDSAQFSMAAANAMTEMCDGDSVMQKLIVTDDLSAVTVAGSAFAGCQLYTPSRDYNWNSLIDGSFLWRACSSFTYVNDSFPVAKNLMEIVVECRNISSLRLFAPVCTSFWYGAHNCIDLDTVDIINDSCLDYRYGFSHTSENGHEFDVFTISNDMKSMNAGTSCFEYNTLPTATYSELIDSLASLNTNIGVTFHGGSSIYLHSVQDERDTLTAARSWTITDGGPLGYTVTGTDVGSGSHGFVGDSVSDPGSTVTIYPIPDVGNVFVDYSGDTSGIVLSGDTATFTMSADRSVTLTFEPDTVSLTLTIVGTGLVDTLPSGKNGLFQALELCTLIAVYTPPDTVVTWSGASSGSADTVVITMDSDKSVTATFSSGAGTAIRRRIWGGFTPSFRWGWRRW